MLTRSFQIVFKFPVIQPDAKAACQDYNDRVTGPPVGSHVRMVGTQTNPQKRREWIAALDKVESLRPRAVIAGHKRPGNEDHPRILEETRQYIRDFDRIAETAKTARELYDQMLKLHPLRMNVYALWTSALAIKG